MKQHTTLDQTAKLIELGFEKPRYATMFWRDNKEVTEINYTIGELIEILSCLPMGMDISAECVVTNNIGRGYGIYTQSKELIDALFEQIVKLKENGVI